MKSELVVSLLVEMDVALVLVEVYLVVFVLVLKLK